MQYYNRGTHKNMVFRWGHFDLRSFAYRAKMGECEVARAKVRSCEGLRASDTTIPKGKPYY